MPGPLTVLFRDDRLLVVDKPSGLAVHKGWAHETDVAVGRARELVGGPVWPVHRLDRATSGALAFALDAEAARFLGDAFAQGRVDKRYLALVRGLPPESGLVDHPVRSGEDTGSARVPAQTAYRRLEVLGRYALVEARPLTGRLHQIRRHMKHLACPLIGDVNYGKGLHNRHFRHRYGLTRLFLHAATLALPHPADPGRVVRVDAPMPAELMAVLARMRIEPDPGPHEPAG